jgi:hypothetical protein
MIEACEAKELQDERSERLERIETTRPVAGVRRVGWSISYEYHYASELKSKVKTSYRYISRGDALIYLQVLFFLGCKDPCGRVTFSIVQMI